jgi:hypothetical protein
VLTLVPDPSILNQPADAVVQVNQPFVISATALGSFPLGYQWRFNGNNLTNAQGALMTNGPAVAAELTYTNPAAQLGDAGAYDLILSNASGSVTSAPAQVRVFSGVELTPLGASPTGFSFSFETLTGFTYQVQYTTNLGATIWLPLGPSRMGSGGSWTNQDLDATNGSRFYRVLVE